LLERRFRSIVMSMGIRRFPYMVVLFVGCVFSLVSSPAVVGAENPSGSGEVVYAEGKDFSVVRQGNRTSYSVSDPQVIGMTVAEGDLIQTGGGTFVEVQLLPRGSVIKIAENSSFLFKGLGPGGATVSLGLLYGRVRAKVATLSGSDSFSIRTGSTVAGVRGTDFGMDSIIQPYDSQPSAAVPSFTPTVRVYCFTGQVAVLPESTEDVIPPSAPAVIVKKNEEVSVDLSSSIPLVERKSLEADTVNYWSQNDFKGSTPVAPPKTPALEVPPPSSTGATTAAPAPTVFIKPDYTPFVRVNNAKNQSIGAAILFTSLGLLIQSSTLAVANYQGESVQWGLFISGSITVGLGFMSLLPAIFINPTIP